MVSDPLRVVFRVAQILESLGIPYLIGGALASAVLGEPRATEDIDIVADISSGQADALIAVLGDEFYVPVDAMRRAILQRSSFNIIHLDTMRKVDVFVMRETGLDREEMTRRRLTVVTQEPERSLYVATAEDLILQKLGVVSEGQGEVGSTVARRSRSSQGPSRCAGSRVSGTVGRDERCHRSPESIPP